MTGKITAPLASLILASVLSGTAAADDLAQIRAISCGTDPAKAQGDRLKAGANLSASLSGLSHECPAVFIFQVLGHYYRKVLHIKLVHRIY